MGKVLLEKNTIISQTNTQATNPSTKVLTMQNMMKGIQQPGGKNKKKSDGPNNTSKNDNNNVGPKKKRDKSKLCKLCDDPHLIIDCPGLVEVK